MNCETWIMTLRSSDLQSDSDLDSICNSCDVFGYGCHFSIWNNSLLLFLPAFLRWFFLYCITMWHCQICGCVMSQWIFIFFKAKKSFDLWSLNKSAYHQKFQKEIEIALWLRSQNCFLLHCLPGKGLEKGNYFNVILCCFYTKVYFSKLHLRA